MLRNSETKYVTVEERPMIISSKDERIRVATVNSEPSKTDGSFRDMVDINNIVAKYVQTGEIVHKARTEGIYADISQIGDYEQSLQKVVDANNAFMTLPAETRNRFGNDPGQLLSFLQDPENYDEGVKLGLLEPKKAQASDPIKRESDAIKKDHQLEPGLLAQFQQFLSRNPDLKKSSEPPAGGSSSQA